MKCETVFAYLTNKKCNWKGKQFLKFNCDCNSIVTFIDLYVTYSLNMHAYIIIQLSLILLGWVWDLINTFFEVFNIVIGFLLLFSFLIGFLSFFFIIFTAFDNNNHLMPLVVSHRKVSSILCFFLSPLFTTFMDRKVHEMAHVSLRHVKNCDCGFDRFKCLTDYRLELWLVKISISLSLSFYLSLSRIAVNEFIFDSFATCGY